jgi:sugar lactone lactonase YvrE
VLAFVPATYKQKISTYTASSTRYVTTDDKKLVASIDVYDGDFHTVKIVPNRFINADSIFIVDAEYMACADLRPVTSYDLAKSGDSHRKEIVWETTLEVCNPDAHVHIWDLATS